MNLVKLFDQGGNEIVLNMTEITSVAFQRYDNNVIYGATAFMRDSTKHIFKDAEAVKLEVTLFNIGVQ